MGPRGIKSSLDINYVEATKRAKRYRQCKKNFSKKMGGASAFTNTPQLLEAYRELQPDHIGTVVLTAVAMRIALGTMPRMLGAVRVALARTLLIHGLLLRLLHDTILLLNPSARCSGKAPETKRPLQERGLF